jgi:galactokinase
MTYSTNIPRHSGLSGSSAIITAAFNGLLEWYGMQEGWPVHERPSFVLHVETNELGLSAGLMDRVAQVLNAGTSWMLNLNFYLRMSTASSVVPPVCIQPITVRLVLFGVTM